MSEPLTSEEKRFAIKYDNGTYFVSYTAIGPMFGGKLRGKNMSKARIFDSATEAQGFIDRDWRMSGSTVVPVKS